MGHGLLGRGPHFSKTLFSVTLNSEKTIICLGVNVKITVQLKFVTNSPASAQKLQFSTTHL